MGRYGKQRGCVPEKLMPQAIQTSFKGEIPQRPKYRSVCLKRSGETWPADGERGRGCGGSFEIVGL